MATASQTRTDTPAHQKILKALAQVDRPGDFCTAGDWLLTLPGLKVDRVGTIALPLSKSQARRLIKQCRQAPYGKGTETIVDTDVRRVWELDPDQFELTNSKWNDCVSQIVEQVRHDLGLDSQKLDAHLYKLLLYEKGSFFLPHRDGEKLDRMVATLVIGLPAEHTGGTLVVSHEDWQYDVDLTAAAEGHELSYVAFYADCEHEVKPLTSGYRLCLVYNLTLARSRGKKTRRSERLGAPSYGPVVESIGRELAKWRDTSENDQKLAVTLEHRYTREGLRVDRLKGADRARADVLFAAAEQADCVAHLARVTLYQQGLAGDGGYGHGYGYSYSWSEEDGGEPEHSIEMEEVYEEELYADQWSDQHGDIVHLARIELKEEEIVAGESLDEWKPSQEDFEGYTGNAGMTLDRWYHHAAVVIWPRRRHFQVLSGAGTDAAAGGLSEMVRRMKRQRGESRKELMAECRTFASAIMDNWSTIKRWSFSHESAAAGRQTFLNTLCALDDVRLVQRFIAEILPADYSVQIAGPFVSFCKKNGWGVFSEELLSLIDPARVRTRRERATDDDRRISPVPIDDTLDREIDWFHRIATTDDADPKRIALCRKLADRMVDVLLAIDNPPSAGSDRAEYLDEYGGYDRYDPVSRRIGRAVILERLVETMAAVDARRPLAKFIRHTLSSRWYDLNDAHLEAIFAMDKKKTLPIESKGVARWVEQCRKELESRTAREPKPFDGFQRPARWPCHCEDCAALARFLADPELEEARFPLAKRRRQHLHHMIDDYRLDCTHVTERRGSPQTLVCKKTNASYHAACKTYRRDCKNLQRIRRIEKKFKQPGR